MTTATHNAAVAKDQMLLIQQRLTKAWSHVLACALDSIQVDTPFAELGGDLNKAGWLRAVCARQGVELSPEQTALSSTVRQQAEAVHQLLNAAADIPGQQASLAAASTLPFETLPEVNTAQLTAQGGLATTTGFLSLDDIEDVSLCTDSQLRMLHATISDPSRSAYWNRYRFSLHPSTDLGLLRRAFQRATAENAMFRTLFVAPASPMAGADFVQVTMKPDSATAAAAFLEAPNKVGFCLGRVPFELLFRQGEVLLWAHHALTDGWATTQLFDRVKQLYHSAQASGLPVPKPTPEEELQQGRSRFSSVVRFLAAEKEAPEGQSHWQTYLEGAEAMSWPRSNDPQLAGCGPCTTEILLHDFEADLDSGAASAGVTSASLVRVALGLTLAKHAGSQDVVYGEITTGRSRMLAEIPDIYKLGGPCISTIPVRLKIDDVNDSDRPWGKLAQEMQRDVQKGRRQVEPRLSSLLPGASRPLTATMAVQAFSSNSSPDAAQDHLDGLDVAKLHDEMPLDLELVLQAYKVSARQWKLCLKYDPRHIAEDDAQIFVRHVAEAAQRMASDPDLSLAAITAPGPDEVSWLQQQLCRPLPAHPLEMPRGFLQRFADQVRRFPSKISLQYGNDTFVSYSDLDRLSSEAAAGILHALGSETFQPHHDRLVGLHMYAGIDMVVMLLAIFKAGCGYLPLNPSHPPDRLRFLMEQASVDVVAVQPSALLPQQAVTRGVVQRTVNELRSHAVASADTDASSILPYDYACLDRDRIAYTLFTSGSTGQPKGVVTTQQNLGCFIEAALATYPLEWNSRRLAFSNFTFDMSVSDFFTTLAQGACLCLDSSDELQDDLQGAIERFAVSYINLTPTVCALIETTSLSSLVCVVLGGEPVSRALASRLQSDPDLTWFNTCGPTETIVDILAVRFDQRLSQKPYMTLGKPLLGGLMSVLILDSQGSPLPVGAAGEICIAGPQVSRGYLGRDDLTTKAFHVGRPGSLWEGRRFYRSGDLGRVHADGNVEHLGRRDGQVKVNGQRIELAEIETALAKHPSVQQAVVLVNKPGSATYGASLGMLVAVIAVKGWSDSCASPSLLPDRPLCRSYMTPGNSDLEADLLGLCSEILPYYMVPSTVLFTKSLLQTVAGKVDTKSLAAALPIAAEAWLSQQNAQERAGSVEECGKPGIEADPLLNDTMAEIKALWSKVLGVDASRLGVDQAFYRSGGDSITAIRLSSEARRLGMMLTVRNIASAQTVREQAHVVIKNRRDTLDADPAIAVGSKSASDSRQDSRLSPIQRRFVSAARSANANMSHYNQSLLFTIQDGYSLSDVERALLSIVETHGMLRAEFLLGAPQLDDCTLTMLPASEARRCFELSEAAIDSTDALNAKLQGLTQRLMPSRGANVGAGLFSYRGDNGKPAQRFLFITVHHLCIDLVSWRIIISDMEVLLASKTATLPAATLSFPAWVMNSVEAAATKTLEPGLAPSIFRHLDMDAQVGAPRKAIEPIRSSLSKQQSTAVLKGCLKDPNLRPLDIMLAALADVVRNTLGHRQLTIGLESHGRSGATGGSESQDDHDDVDISRTVGWFTRVDAITLDLSGSFGASETLARVTEACRQNRRPQPEDTVLDVLINYHGSFQEAEKSTGPIQLASASSKVGVSWKDHDDSIPDDFLALTSIEISLVAGSLEVGWTLPRRRPGLHATLRSLAQQFTQRLASIAAWCDQAPSGRLCLAPSDVTGGRVMQIGEMDALARMLDGSGGMPLLADVEQLYPCSPMQEGLVAQQMASTDGLDYVTYRSYVLPPSANLAGYRAAYHNLVTRHAALRTVFLAEAPCGMLQAVLRASAVQPEWYTSEATKIAGPDDNSAIRSWILSRGIAADLLRPAHAVGIFPAEAGGGYVLVWCLHHSLIDAWSMKVLEDDLMDLLAGVNAARLPPPVSFGEVVGHVNALDDRDAMRFFAEYLADARATEFPADAPPVPASANGALARVKFEVKGQRQPALLARQRGILPSTLFYTAWALVLGCQTGTSGALFACVLSGRALEMDGINRAVGPCITTVPVWTQWRPDQVLSDLLLEQQKHQTDLVHHGHIGLRRLQQEGLLGSANQMLKTYATYQNLKLDFGPEARTEFGSPTLQYDYASDALSHPLDLTALLDVDERLHVHVDYDPAVMLDEDVRVVLGRLLLIVDQICDNPDIKVSELIFETPSHIAIREASTNEAPIDAFCASLQPVTRMFESQASRTPSKIALQFSNDLFITYRTLLDRSLDFARGLTSLVGGQKAVVPLCLGKSEETIIAMLGCLFAGCAYAPIDPEAPIARKEHICLETASRLVISTAGLLDGCSRIESLENLSPREVESRGRTREHQVAMLPQVNPHDLAMVLFTGGSTGLPKAVQIEHEQISSFIVDSIEAYPIDHYTHKLSFASYTFDMHLFDVYGSLSSGAVVITDTMERMMSDLHAVVHDHDITYCDLTPSVANLLDPTRLPFLAALAVGGEALTGSFRDKFAPHLTLINAFGPTECPADTISFAWTKDNHERDRFLPFVPIGKAFGHTRCYLLDDEMKPVPLGVPGMLWNGGPQVARGYLGRPELNEVVFLPDPFEKVPGRRLYCTGDVCILHANGLLQHVGRRDTMVKLHGVRIDVADVEAVIQAISGVANVAVELVKSSQGKHRLAAFILTDEHKAQALASTPAKLLGREDQLKWMASDLTKRMAAATQLQLQAVMRPTFWVFVSQMRHLFSGKIDRKHLHGLFKTSDSDRQTTFLLSDDDTGSEQAYWHATGQIESAIEAVFCSVLGLEASTIPRKASFATLGGDSIDAMRVTAVLRRLGHDTDVRSLNAAAALSTFAAALADAAATKASSGATASRPDAVTAATYTPFLLVSSDVLTRAVADLPLSMEDAYPLTAAQASIAASALNTPAGGEEPYFTKFFAQVPVHTNVEDLKRAWLRTVRESPALRTAFIHCSEARAGLLQVVLQPHCAAQQWQSAEAASDASVDEMVKRLGAVLDEALPGFTLGSPNAVATCAQDSESGKTVLAIKLHHSLYDGVSLDLIFDRLASALARGQSSLPEDDTADRATPNLGQFIAHTNAIDTAASKKFWRQLAGDVAANPVAAGSLAATSAEGKMSVGRNGRQIVRLHRSIRAFCRHHQVTPASLMKAIFAFALLATRSVLHGAAETASGMVVFAEISTGRAVPVADVEQLESPTFAVVANALDGRNSVIAAAKEAQRQQQDRADHEQIGIEAITQALFGSRTNLKHLFAWQVDKPFSSASDATSTNTKIPIELAAVEMELDYELALEASFDDTGDALLLAVTHRDDLVPAEGAVAFLAHMVELLDATLDGTPPILPQTSLISNDRLWTSLAGVGPTQSMLQRWPKRAGAGPITGQNERFTGSCAAQTIANVDIDAFRAALATLLAAWSSQSHAIFAEIDVDAGSLAPVVAIPSEHEDAVSLIAALCSQRDRHLAALGHRPWSWPEASGTFDVLLSHGSSLHVPVRQDAVGLHVDLLSSDPGGMTIVKIHFDIKHMVPQDAQAFLDQLCQLAEGYRTVPAGLNTSANVLEASVADAHQVLKSFNRVPGSDGDVAPILFLDQLARHAEQVSNKISVQFRDTHFLTYAQLAVLTDRAACGLLALGVARGEAVAISMSKSSDMVVALIGVLKAGAAWVSIDPDHPLGRRQMLLQQAGAKLIITDGDFITTSFNEDEGHGHLIAPKTVCLSELLRSGKSIVHSDSDLLLPAVEAQDAAYIVFTSGSTGRPKGVLIEHGNLASHLLNARESHQTGWKDKRFSATAVTFDPMVTDILGALADGACSCLASSEQTLSELNESLDATLATSCIVTSSVLRSAGADMLPFFGKAVLGGEPIQLELVRQLQNTGTSVFNAYGPCETVVSCVSIPFDEAALAQPFVALGRPEYSCRVYILNGNDRLAPLGVPGEICVGGAQVGRTYLDASLNADRFMADPFYPNDRLYKTGDIGVMHANGIIEYLGRRDGQVKVNGVRVELGEVESVIAQAASHRELHSPVLVIVEKCKVAKERDALVAFISHEAGALSAESTLSLDSDADICRELRDATLKLLPPSLCPAMWRFTSRLPLNIHGKIDRKRLKATLEEGIEADRASVLPAERALSASDEASTSIEKVVADALADLLSVALDRISMSDSFVSLGGDSLQAIRLAAALRKQGISSRSADLFAAPSLRAFCATLSQKTEPSNFKQSYRPFELVEKVDEYTEWQQDASAAGIKDSGRVRDVYPAMDMQSLLLHATMSDKDNMPYLQTLNFCLEADVGRLSAVVKAWTVLVSETDLLCTSFLSTKGGLVQVVQDPRDLDLVRMKLDGAWTAEEARNHRLDTINASASEPPHRLLVSRRGELDFKLEWVIHHALYDGWSIDLLLQRWQLLQQDDPSAFKLQTQVRTALASSPSLSVSSASSGTSSPTPSSDGFSAATSDYHRSDLHSSICAKSQKEGLLVYGAYIKFLLRSSPLDRDFDFWQAYLSQAKTPSWPSNARTLKKREMAAVTHSIPAKLLETAKASLGFTAPAVLRAAIALAVGWQQGRDNVVIGEVLSGRDMPLDGIERMTGPCIATQPVVIPSRPQKESQVASFCKKIQEDYLLRAKHSRSGLGQIADRCGNVALSFSILLVMQMQRLDNNHVNHRHEAANPVAMLDTANDSISDLGYSLAIHICPGKTSEDVEVRLEYELSTLSEADATAFGEQIERATALLGRSRSRGLAYPDSNASSLSTDPSVLATSEEDLRWQLYDVNGWRPDSREETAFDKLELVTSRIDRQSRSLPNKVAIEFDSSTFITYGELSRRAKLIVGRLVHGGGVKRGMAVPLFFKRSAVAVLAQIAVLKAGAAFVPIDIEFPRARVEAIIDSLRESEGGVALFFLTTLELADKVLERGGSRALCLEDLEVAADDAAPDLLPPIKGSDLAYVLFTSGSSGTPKGCALTHANLASMVSQASTLYGMDQRSRPLNFSPYVFDVSLGDFFVTLCYGGCLVILPHERLFSDVASNVESLRISTVSFTPTVARLYGGGSSSFLRRMIVAGEEFPADIAAELCAGDVEVFNAYGPTEATIFATVHRVSPDDGLRGSVPIGRAYGKCRVYVMQEDMRSICPSGTAGELCIAGPQVGLGYLVLDRATSERFLPDPFGPGRMYRTGDIVRLRRGTGLTDYVGRKDAEVKIRGKRIHLGEVRSQALSSDSAIEDAVPVCTGNGSSQRLCLFLTASKQIHEDAGNQLVARVLQRLRDTLPQHAVPTNTFIVDQLPINANGKVDRRKLAELAVTRCAANAIPAATLSIGTSKGLESAIDPNCTLIAQIWATVLQRDVAGLRLDSAFADEGGDSLFSIQLVALGRKRGAVLQMHQVGPESTIESQAACLSQRNNKDADHTAPQADNVVRLDDDSDACSATVDASTWFLPDYTGVARQWKRAVPRFAALGLTLQGAMFAIDDLDLGKPLEECRDQTISALAETYVAKMLAIRPHDRLFRIIGWSFGGLIALEAARILRSAAPDIKLHVVLLDTLNPAHPEVALRLEDEHEPETMRDALRVQRAKSIGMMRRHEIRPLNPEDHLHVRLYKAQVDPAIDVADNGLAGLVPGLEVVEAAWRHEDFVERLESF